jgi:hypothetical protein
VFAPAQEPDQTSFMKEESKNLRLAYTLLRNVSSKKDSRGEHFGRQERADG